MFGDTEQRNCETALLTELSDQLRLCRDPGEAGSVIARYAGQLFPAASGALYVRHDDGFYELAASWGGFPVVSGDGAFSPYECLAIRQGRAHGHAGPDAGSICNHLGRGEAEPPCQSQRYLCLPIVTQEGDVPGILHLRCRARAELSSAPFSMLSTFRLAMIVVGHMASSLTKQRSPHND